MPRGGGSPLTENDIEVHQHTALTLRFVPLGQMQFRHENFIAGRVNLFIKLNQHRRYELVDYHVQHNELMHAVEVSGEIWLNNQGNVILFRLFSRHLMIKLNKILVKKANSDSK